VQHQGVRILQVKKEGTKAAVDADDTTEKVGEM